MVLTIAFRIRDCLVCEIGRRSSGIKNNEGFRMQILFPFSDGLMTK